MNRPRILVVGDVILDRYIYGTADRMSPEAPVPVFIKTSEEHRLGGAANVAANVSALGGHAFLMGLINDRIHNLARQWDVNTDACYPGIITTKTRYIVDHHHLLRIDNDDSFLSHPVHEDIADAIEHNAIEAIIVSDYAKGFVTEPLLREIGKITNESAPKIPVFIDPKPDNAHLYAFAQATDITPNLAEFEKSSACHGDIDRALNIYKDLTEADNVIITLGDKGAIFYDGDKIIHSDVPPNVPVFDVTGAGDVFIAAWAIACFRDIPIKDVLDFAVQAATYSVAKFGTTVVSINELDRNK